MGVEHRTWVLATRHPIRMAILDSLANGMKVSPDAFAARKSISPATARYHLDILQEVGAIDEKDGEEFTLTERGLMLRNLAQPPSR